MSSATITTSKYLQRAAKGGLAVLLICGVTPLAVKSASAHGGNGDAGYLHICVNPKATGAIKIATTTATATCLPTTFIAMHIAINGATGPQGLQGPAGLTGPQGPQGPVGPQGPAGNDGANGTNGLDGAAGANGTNGLDGAAGANGLDGAAGTNGLDGAN